MDTKELIALAVSALEEVKAQNVVDLDVRDLTPLADHMLIATGTSSTHVKALCNKLIQEAKDAGTAPQNVEGEQQAEWILVDLGAVIVHIMTAPTRALYSLEDLWNFSAREVRGEGEN